LQSILTEPEPEVSGAREKISTARLLDARRATCFNRA